ncbi:hypothetical protein N0V83_006246 [Neocucurbitaria cava]|uniref:Uncharacterized protein n=1 Tax=Neocucurbitaria cava TaxID=798079 RepID=A0A9W8Y6Z1_9PLEO|nr:hypothetical protein N0V83_006246 [Neocucurbitaria cava]
MPSFLSSVAAHAKAHHESLNAAYSTYYSPRSSTSMPPSTETSRANSVTVMPAEQKRNPTNAAKAWNAIKKHHQEMNEAYQVFYSPGASASSSRSNSVVSVEQPRQAQAHEEEAAAAPRNYQKVWKSLKNKAVEHHKSVNSAYAMTYGGL